MSLYLYLIERHKTNSRLKTQVLSVYLPGLVCTSLMKNLSFFEEDGRSATDIVLYCYNPPHAKKETTIQEYMLFKRKCTRNYKVLS